MQRKLLLMQQTRRSQIVMLTNQKADTAISKAQNSNQGAEQTVQDAIRALQEVQEEAANDSADALTADIQQKIAELQTAVTAAAKTQEEARNAADDAKQQTAPVTNEPAVQTALDELNEVLNNPASTAEAIKQATQQLLNATEDTLKLVMRLRRMHKCDY